MNRQKLSKDIIDSFKDSYIFNIPTETNIKQLGNNDTNQISLGHLPPLLIWSNYFVFKIVPFMLTR